MHGTRATMSHPAVPDLRGTWKGRIESSWHDPKTGRGVPPIEAYYVIRQAGSVLRIRLLTRDARSDLLVGRVFVDTDGQPVVTGVYRNEPGPVPGEGSPVHHGAILVGVKDGRLQGTYWTDRDTHGTLRFTGWRRGLAREFAKAAAAEYAVRQD